MRDYKGKRDKGKYSKNVYLRNSFMIVTEFRFQNIKCSCAIINYIPVKKQRKVDL